MDQPYESDYHQPVLLKESVESLAIQPDGIYVDATFGGGGHSRAILNQLGANGHLYGFDQDEEALRNVFENERFTFIPHNFRHLRRFLRLYGSTQVDGILADLGVSSHQIDSETRGFSYRFDAPLDMRMNQQGGQTAADLLQTLSADELQSMFSRYGEVRNARTLAQTIVKTRSTRSFEQVGAFVQAIEPLIRGNRHRYLAQVFQALRIAVNDELLALEDFLTDALSVLKPGGRLVVISYHSAEDRMVKYFLKTGNPKGEVEKDDFGNIYRPFKIITKKAILPTAEEIERNSRARSAKMRVGEVNDE